MPSKKLFLSSAILFVLVSFLFVGSVGASSEMWSHTYGGEVSEKAYSLVETSDGGYALAGYTYSPDTEESDVWLVKTDAYGNMMWNQTYEGGLVRALVKTSDGGYALAGSANKGDWDVYTDFWLVKTDEYGNMEWNQTYGRVDAEWIRITGEVLDKSFALVETSDGGFALTGDTSPHLLGSPRDIWLVKTDAYGVMEWNRTYGGASYESAFSLIVTSEGGYAIAGYTNYVGAGKDFWLLKTDSDGNLLWNGTYGEGSVHSLVETSDGGYAIAGDARLVKTDVDGNMMWNQTYDGKAYALVQTSDGGYALAGTKNDDFWLAKTDEHGIIPEFPSWIIIPLFLIATVVVIIYGHRLRRKVS